MAESSRRSSGDFAKKVQRQLSRGKEKVAALRDLLFLAQCHSDVLTLPFCVLLQVLQKLGKTAETRDQQFEQCLRLFIDQQVIRFATGGKKNNNCMLFTATLGDQTSSKL